MNDLEYIINKYEEEGFSKEKIDKIKQAYNYALEKHKGKKRKDGNDFINHPLSVARILCDLNVDDTTIISALVHETISESDATGEELEKLFDSDVRNIVESLTKINKLKLNDDSESSSLYLRKVLVGLSEDPRVLIIKLADRLHNMRTLKFLKRDRQIAISQETRDLYAPLANRLRTIFIKMGT